MMLAAIHFWGSLIVHSHPFCENANKWSESVYIGITYIYLFTIQMLSSNRFLIQWHLKSGQNSLLFRPPFSSETKSLFMVQNVLYSNGQPSHVALPFEYWPSILSSIQMNRVFGIQMVTVLGKIVYHTEPPFS